jgi:hypothetical protein
MYRYEGICNISFGALRYLCLFSSRISLFAVFHNILNISEARVQFVQLPGDYLKYFHRKFDDKSL